MIFAEKMEVSYKNMCGIIDFVCDQYVVVQLPSAGPKRGNPRLLVHKENYKHIEVIKDSGR